MVLLLTTYIVGASLSAGLFAGGLFVAGAINHPWSRRGINLVRSSEYTSGAGMTMTAVLILTMMVYAFGIFGFRNIDFFNLQVVPGEINGVEVADINTLIHALFTAGIILWTIWCVGCNIAQMLLIAIFWFANLGFSYAAYSTVDTLHFILLLVGYGITFTAILGMLFGGYNKASAKLICMIPYILWAAYSIVLSIFTGPINADWSVILYVGLDLIVGHSFMILLPLFSYMFLPRIEKAAGGLRFGIDSTEGTAAGQIPVNMTQVRPAVHEALLQASVAQ